MGSKGADDYPGNACSPEEILRLAEQYKRAARLAQDLARAGDPITRAPFHLTAIHAIELYLTAFLRLNGHPPEALRGLMHDLRTRADLAHEKGLILRKKTREHLEAMTAQREYLVTRYGPEMVGTISKSNRLMATLEEVAAKVNQKAA